MRFKKTITILGDKWVIYLISKEQMKKLDGYTSTEAITYPQLRRIYFQDRFFTKDTVAHEVFHAYKSYLCLEAATEMGLGSLEEIMCEMYAKYRYKMEKTTKEIYRKLK